MYYILNYFKFICRFVLTRKVPHPAISCTNPVATWLLQWNNGYFQNKSRWFQAKPISKWLSRCYVQWTCTTWGRQRIFNGRVCTKWRGGHNCDSTSSWCSMFNCQFMPCANMYVLSILKHFIAIHIYLHHSILLGDK